MSFYIYGKKQSVCESHRNTERGILGGEGADMRVVFTSVLMGPLLCALSVGATRISGSTRGRRVGERDEQCSLVHCTLSAVLPLACFVRRRPLWNPLRNGKSGPSETTTQTPYPHTSSSVPQNPWQQRQGQEGSEAREKRGGALKKRSARFSGSRIQAPWPCAAWMWPSVFSSPAHFHLDVSE